MIVYLTGPTASGKTEVSLRLAENLGAEIVNCDALQVYKGLDTATAKATAEEQARVPHHLLDILEPDRNFNVSDYQAIAQEAIEEILTRGKNVLVVGGTLQYLKSLRYDYEYSSPPSDPAVRARLEEEAERRGGDALHQRLVELDPARAAKLHPNDVIRVIRALEIIELSGKMASSFLPVEKPGKYWGPLIILWPDRAWLYERINRRVDRMLEEGLLDEVKALYELNPEMNHGVTKAIGYKELVPYLAGEEELSEAVGRLKQATRNFAKRQLTGLRNIEDAFYLPIGPETSSSESICRILRQLSDISD